MATRTNIKARWMKLPVACFETLRFGDLEIGQQFICLPQPGDNRGHGGFRGVHYIFTKTRTRVYETMGKVSMPYSREVPHGRARNNKHQTRTDFPLSMPVILVE